MTIRILDVTMAVKIVMAVLLLLFSLVTGLSSTRPKEIHVKVGEMVTLRCPRHKRGNSNATLSWTSHTVQEVDLTNVSSEDQTRTGVVVHGRNLVIFNASVTHQGNYSCSMGYRNDKKHWFRLRVHTPPSKEYDDKLSYSLTCFTQETCTLMCPDVNTPPLKVLNIISNEIKWQKVGESLSAPGYFPAVEVNDSGVYICTRSYLYHKQVYNMTFRVILDVQPSIKTGKPLILSPQGNSIINVDLGSEVVVNCTADMYSEFDEVFWLSGKSFVDSDDKLPVFSNYTREHDGNKITMTASLVFKNVSVEDLSKNYTCKLESSDETSSFVTITLKANHVQDPYLEFGMLSDIHAALVEQQTRLVFIKTEATGGSASGSVPEALQRHSKARNCITWKGMRSMPLPSLFWKKLCYCLLPPKRQLTNENI